ncbi:hypothetical protein JCM10213_008094 [Rhodosporidiobolus nylandii]
MAQLHRVTYCYKRLRAVEYKADVYLPDEEDARRAGGKDGAPVLCYYHGGGMCAGNRGWNDWLGKWLFYDALTAGFVVISFDYTLVSPDTAFQIIEDVKDGLLFIRDELNQKLAHETAVRVDSRRVAVSGASGGGCVAYYAGHHSPYPLKAVLAFYAEGGDFMLDWYNKEKTEPFFLNIPLLDDLSPYERLRDQSKDAPPEVWTDIGWTPNNRGIYYFYLLQTGQAVDVLSGIRGLSKRLLDLPLAERAAAVPPEARAVFPSLDIPFSFPPTYLLHGMQDTAVSIDESRNLSRALREAGVEVKLWEVEGGEHGFDTENGWPGGPGGKDPVLTRKRNEGLKGVVPWLLERV